MANNLTVKENLEFFANIYNNNDVKTINEIIDIFNLNEVLNQRAKSLSGGYIKKIIYCNCSNFKTKNFIS